MKWGDCSEKFGISHLWRHDLRKTIAFVNLCRALKETHFTRIRKMSLDNLMLSVLFRKGRTLHMELRSFKKLLGLKDTISKVGYLKQRLKLNPVAFLALARHHAGSFYKDTQMVKRKMVI